MTKVKLTNSEKDLVLVDVVKNGKRKDAEKAFAELYKKYNNLIIFNYRPKVKNEADVEDLAAEVMTKCYKNIKNYEKEKGAFSTWIFSMTLNLFIDNLRKQKADLVSVDDLGTTDNDGHYTAKELKSSALNAEDELIKAEKSERLSQLMATVLEGKSNLREMLELKYFSEMSYVEIAVLCDCPLGTVKAHIFRAKELLRKAIKKDNIEL